MVGVLKTEKPKVWLFAVVTTFLGLILSLYSSYEFVHLRYFPYLGGEAACNINAQFNCEHAIRSQYAFFLGRSLGCWGAFFYASVLFFLFFFSNDEGGRESSGEARLGLSIFLWISLFSLIASGVLGYISFKELSALCPVCIALYLISLVLFILVYLLEAEASLGERLRVGFLGLFRFPLLASRFFIKQLGNHLFTLNAPVLLGTLAVVVISFFSDVLIYQFLDRTQGLEAKTNIAVAGWLGNPEQEIPFDESSEALKDYRRGNPSAPIRIVEFFDFECPACRSFAYDLKDILADHKDMVSIEYRNYPLDHSCNENMRGPFHVTACAAAEFARCAGEQGKFFEAVDYLLTMEEFDSPDRKRDLREEVRGVAQPLGLDEAALDECLESDRQLEVIKRDIDIAESIGLKGTPSVWVNGRKLPQYSLLPDLVTFLVKKRKSD